MSASEARDEAPDPVVAGALDRLGIPRDGVLMVHSSFKTMAREGHDLGSVLGALVDYMAAGALLMPAMSWRFVNPRHPVFDELATPSNTGALAELFRIRFATTRSLHPTHSVAGRGLRAAEMLGQHHLDETPCSARSPFGMLIKNDGWVLMMGIGMDCCTLIHHIEEVVAPDLYLRPASEREAYTCRDRSGREFAVHLRRHLFLPRDYWQFQDLLAARGELRLARIDNAVCRAFRARDMARAVTQALEDRPEAIIARTGQRYRMM